jgi:hypothetical protein
LAFPDDAGLHTGRLSCLKVDADGGGVPSDAAPGLGLTCETLAVPTTSGRAALLSQLTEPALNYDLVEVPWQKGSRTTAGLSGLPQSPS